MKKKISDDDAVVIVVRAMLGESALDLAREHGIGQSYVSSLRHGHYRPHVLERALAYWHRYYDEPPPPHGRPGRRRSKA